MNPDYNVTDIGHDEASTEYDSHSSSEELSRGHATVQAKPAHDSLDQKNGLELANTQKSIDEDSLDVEGKATSVPANNTIAQAAKVSPSLEGSTPDDSLSFQVPLQFMILNELID